MATIQVRAVATGFYAGGRRRPGAVFDMDREDYEKTGKGAIPRWVEPADAPPKPVVKRDPKLHTPIEGTVPNAAKRAAEKLALAAAVPDLGAGDDGADLV